MAKPTIYTYYSPRTTIDRGDSTGLVWSVYNADTVSISHIGVVVHTGGKQISPSTTTSYMMNAVNDEGNTVKTVKITVIQPEPPEPEPPEPPPPIPEPPEPGECPDFWKDPIGWTVCMVTNGFSSFLIWFSSSFLTFISNLQLWAAAFTLEFWKFLQDPFKYVNDAIRAFIIGQEQKVATDYLDLRKNEDDHWESGTDWIAGQYKNVDDLTEAEFQALVDKGISDNKDELRAADFRIYKLDDSSRSTFEAVMHTLRSSVGGLWLAIDTRTEELVGWDSEQFTYMVNWVEEKRGGLLDLIGDLGEGLWTFVNGGFLNANQWMLAFTMDIAEYTDSKIVDIKEWFDIEIPELLGPMFEWAKPIVQPIIDAVGFLGEIVGIVTGTAPESTSVKAVKKNYKEQTDRVKEILGR